MKHISDKILEVYALNRHALGINQQLEVYQHIGSCSECRKVLNYLCSIWKKDLHLVFEAIEVSDSEVDQVLNIQHDRSYETATHLNSIGHYITSYSQKKLRISKSFSEFDWFINVTSDSELNNSIVLSKLSLLSKWIFLSGNQRSPLTGLAQMSPEILLKSTAIYKISQDVILPSDTFMTRNHQNTILIDTHCSELNSAILENPQAQIAQHYGTFGTFEIPAKLWTAKSRMHLFSL